jgi:hypothetical protein
MKTNTRIVSLALAVLVAATLVPIPAGAAIANYLFLGLEAVGTDCTLDSRIGKTSTDTKHVVNLADCLELKKNACAIKVNWTLNSVTTADWHWYSKLSLPNGTCTDSDITTLGTSCLAELYYGEQDFLSAAGVAIPIQIQVVGDSAGDATLTTSGCAAGTDFTTNLYVIVYTPALLATQTATYTGQSIPFRFDLKPPVAPKLEESDEGDSNITVKWSDPDNGDEAGIEYVVYWGKEKFDATSLALAKRSGPYSVKSHQLTGLDNEVLYWFAVAAVDTNGNEGPLSVVNTAMPVPVLDFFEAYRDGDGGVGREKGGYCFIATAAYGSAMADQVWTLRTFRDRFLLSWGPGRGLVATYYALSPPLADFIAGNDTMRAVVRVVLWPLVAAAGWATALPSGWGFVLPLLLVLMVVATGFATLTVVRARRRS